MNKKFIISIHHVFSKNTYYVVNLNLVIYSNTKIEATLYDKVALDNIVKELESYQWYGQTYLPAKIEQVNEQKICNRN